MPSKVNYGKERSLFITSPKEFKWFHFMFRNCAWSMQFVLIEWEVYRLTKDPWSLGLIGLIKIPAIGSILFAGHIVDQSRKRAC